MRADDPYADNILARLLSYTPRKDRTALEDFCTETLAWCLRNSREFQTKFLRLVKDSLAAGKRDLFVIGADTSIDVTTQFGFSAGQADEDDESDSKRGRFDLVIRSVPPDEFVLVLEVKIDSEFGATQIPRYRQELLSRLSFQESSKKFLATLTKRREISREIWKHLDAALYWTDVHRLLEESANSGGRKSDGVSSSVSKFVMCQFAEFLKSKGMYSMQIPKTSTKQSFKDGVLFCYSLHKILLEVRDGSIQLKSLLRSRVELREESDHCLWVMLWHKPSQPHFALGCKLRPEYELLVEAGWLKTPAKRKDFLKDRDKDMKFWHWDDHWRDGFGITGKLTRKLEGNADSIKDWFERAARLAIEHRKGN
jgi:hypothetical protein